MTTDLSSIAGAEFRTIVSYEYENAARMISHKDEMLFFDFEPAHENFSNLTWIPNGGMMQYAEFWVDGARVRYQLNQDDIVNEYLKYVQPYVDIFNAYKANSVVKRDVVAIMESYQPAIDTLKSAYVGAQISRTDSLESARVQQVIDSFVCKINERNCDIAAKLSESMPESTQAEADAVAAAFNVTLATRKVEIVNFFDVDSIYADGTPTDNLFCPDCGRLFAVANVPDGTGDHTWSTHLCGCGHVQYL